MGMFEMYLGNRIKRIYIVDWIQGVNELKLPDDFCHESLAESPSPVAQMVKTLPVMGEIWV